jgi:UDP-N-acetylglucosamine 2-epimerase
MEPNDFLKLIYNSKCLIGNSSVGIRESSFLGIPVVNIGSRQDGRKRGKNVIDCDYNKEEIKNAIKKHLKHGHYKSEFIYGDGNAGQKIADVLSSCELKFHKTITY